MRLFLIIATCFNVLFSLICGLPSAGYGFAAIGMALLFGAIGGINLNFLLLKDSGTKRYYFLGWFRRFLVFYFISFCVFMWVMPGLIGPAGIIGAAYKVLGWYFLINIIWSGVELIIIHEESRHRVPGGSVLLLIILGAVLLIPGFIWAVCTPLVYAVELHELAEVKETELGNVFPTDTKHIRVVSKQTAQWLADKALGEAEGNLGSIFQVGDVDIQKVGNELYWVAPLEFRGFFKWWKMSETPGFVMVSAEDENRYQLITGRKLKYMRTAYFTKNLERHLYYSGYQSVVLTEYTFEVDDNLNPYWVVSVLEPNYFYSGESVRGVAIVNPETGDIDFKTPEEAPAWIDRIFPEELAEDYLTWWGKYRHGFWNTLFSEKDVIIPTPFGEDENQVFMIWGTEDGWAHWITGITSISSQDQALVGTATIQTRTGGASFIRLSGMNEQAILENVNSEVANYSGNWKGTQPIPHIMYSQLSFISPIIGDPPTIKQLAIVNAKFPNVIRGETKNLVLSQYRRFLSKLDRDVAPSQEAFSKSISGMVGICTPVVVDGNTVYYVLLNAVNDRFFTVDPTIMPEVLAVEEEASVASIQYLESNEPIVPAESFDLQDFDLRKSETQQEFEEQRAVQEKTKTENWDEQQELIKKLEDLRKNKK